VILLKKNESGVASPEKILANEDVFLKDKSFSYSAEELKLPYDVGTRKLSDEKISQLVTSVEPLYASPIITQKALERAAKKIALILYTEDINFESSLNLFNHINADIGALIEIYNDPQQEQYSQPLYRLLFDEMYGDPLKFKEAQKIENDIRRIACNDPFEGMVIARTGTDINIINSSSRKEIIYQKQNEINGKDYSKEKRVVNAYLKKLIVYDSPLSEDPRRFKSIFESKVCQRPINIGPVLLDDIVDYLSESGYVEESQLIKNTIPSIFNAFIAEGKAIMKNEIEYPGFFYDFDNDKIIAIKYDIEDISSEQLKNSLILLEKFANWFENQKIKLAHVFKWGLISPFIFAIKQKGRWVNWQFLFGSSGSGKTTIGDLILYLWGEPDNNTNNIGGSSFNTEYRIGNRLSLSTFPIVVNEPQGAFVKPPVVEMLKSAIERTTSRGKNERGRYKNIPSFAPVILTSNHALIDDDAMARRLDMHLFSHSERKTEEDKEAFAREFRMDNIHECVLHGLKPIAQFVVAEILEDPSLLDMQWRELANTLIVRMYTDTGLEAPEWLLSWNKTETLADMDELHIEKIRIFLQSEINKAYGRIDVYDEDGYRKDKVLIRNDVKTSNDFENRVWTVLNERTIPWMFLNKNNDIVLSSGFIDALKKDACINENLVSIAELLNWKHGNGRVRGAGFSGRHISVNKDKFTSFVFPTCDIGEDCE